MSETSEIEVVDALEIVTRQNAEQLRRMRDTANAVEEKIRANPHDRRFEVIIPAELNEAFCAKLVRLYKEKHWEVTISRRVRFDSRFGKHYLHGKYRYFPMFYVVRVLCLSL